MDGLLMFLVVFLGVVSYSHGWISGSLLEVTVRSEDNITLYCDCRLSSGASIVWFRNCSHENQPSLVLKPKIGLLSHPTTGSIDPLMILPRFQFVKNSSSDSYDLLIRNVTNVDEGLYYCGTERKKVEENVYITEKYNYRYGNVTRLIINSSETHHHHLRETPQDCGVCWMLLFSLCPAFALLSSLLSSLVVHQLCSKKAKEPDAEPNTGQATLNQDEVCYAALEIRQASRRPKKKKTQTSDFSTYSAINTSRM